MSGIRTQRPPKWSYARILPEEEIEPTMQKNVTINITEDHVKMYHNFAIKSVTKKLSEVSQIMSECQQLLNPINNIDEILPFCSDLLSGLYDLVQSVGAKQNQPSLSTIPVSMSSSSVDSSCDSSSLFESKSVGDLFVSNMARTIDKLSTKSIYNKRKARKMRKKRLLMSVPSDFVAIWQNCDKIFCQAPGLGPKKFNHQPRISVNWSKVNTRAFSNLPTPQDIPLYGCSQYPITYQGWHEKRTPFGSIPGFKTSLGIITVDSIREPIHGFVYIKELGGWVIHASDEKDDIKTKSQRDANLKLKRRGRAKEKQHTHHHKHRRHWFNG